MSKTHSRTVLYCTNMEPIAGVYTALITPFQEDSSLDTDSLRSLVDMQIENKVSGLVPVGTTGESPTLSPPEHIETIRVVIDQAKGRVPVIAGTGSNNTDEAIELSLEAKRLGAAATLQVCPYYNKPSQEGLYQHFLAIAEKTELPLIVYNIPGRTGKNIELETLQRLLEHPLIVGVKEASGTIVPAVDLLQYRQEQSKRFSILSGDDALVLGMMVHGAEGVISVASNVIPRRMVGLVKSASTQNFADARKELLELLPFFRATFVNTNPIPIKYAASRIGLCLEKYRLPLCSPDETQKSIVDSALRGLGLLSD